MHQGRLRVLIADDHEVVRASLVELVQACPDLQVIGDVGDGLAAVERTLALQPDLLLVDLNMPGLDGLAVIRHVRRRLPILRILVLTLHTEPEWAHSARAAGANGYLIKDCSAEELQMTIRHVFAVPQTSR